MDGTTFLEIMTDNDGNYSFESLIDCGSYSNAKSFAWIQHKKFLDSDEGKDFLGEGSLNSSKENFIEAISKDGMVITADCSATVRRVYRLIRMDISVKISPWC